MSAILKIMTPFLRIRRAAGVIGVTVESDDVLMRIYSSNIMPKPIPSLLFCAIKSYMVHAVLVVIALLAPCAARADFPSEISRTDVDSVTRTYDCDKFVIEGPISGLILTPRGVRNNSDTKYHQPYHAACHVYVSNELIAKGAEPGYTERFLIYGSDAATKPLMTKAAKLLIVLWAEVYGRLKRDHSPDEPTVQVWLTPQKGAGLSSDIAGEQFKNQIYIYDVTQERRPLEWVREIAHEYGHYSLPGVSGYKEPEEWANGVLGERLFLMWIHSELRNGKLNPDAIAFTDATGLEEYITRQVTPLISSVRAVGVTEKQMARRDAAGMDAYTGLALYIDSVYGDAQLLSTMSYTASPDPARFVEGSDFLAGFNKSIAATDELTITLVSKQSGSHAAATVYLAPGTYVVSSNLPAKSSFVSLSGIKQKQLDSRSVVISSSNWYHLQVEFIEPLPKVASVKLTRRNRR